jgi:glycosyltransferase involved in cell wall biosynthesis
MNILCISSSVIPAPTAHSMQLMKVCQALVQLGNQVELVVPGPINADWESIAAHYGLSVKFRIRYLKSRRTFRRYDFSIRAICLARRQGIDLVYTWLLPAAVMALWVNLPAIFESHDQITGWGAPWLFRRFVSSDKKKRLAVITQALGNKIIRAFSISAESLDVVIAPNGVDLDRYSDLPSPSQARKQLNLPERITVGYTGGFYAGRGIELLHALARQNPEIQFIWAGGSTQSIKEWQDRLMAEGLDNVLLTGFVDNQRLPLYQAAADILAMPFGMAISGSSGGNTVDICSPMKMFDYLASGRAIMASDIPVLHEVLNDRNAVLLPPEDLYTWQQALKRLAVDAKLRQSFGKQARLDAARYTWVNREATILRGFIVP